MGRTILRIVGLTAVAMTIVGLWFWRQSSLPSTPKSPPSTPSASASASVEDDNFLPIERAPGVNLQTTLNNSFVIPAGTNMAKITTVVTTGDIIPARGTDIQIRNNGPDYPFAGLGIQGLLSQADLTVVDLESPLTAACPVTKTGFTFCGQPSFASAMAKAGIDVATIENNHIGNYGRVGIDETIQHLTAAGLRYASSTYLDIETIHGLKIGLLAFNGVGGRFYPDAIKQKIAEARPQVDLLFVAYHWGKEYESVPTADPAIAPDDPRTIGRMTIDAGADLVIGNHPHWVQGVEIYKGKLISYALGNFIFDQSWSRQTMQGIVGKYTFYGTKLIGAQYTPIHIDNQAQPKMAAGDEAAEIMDQFKQSSQQLAAVSQ
jgi:poly-gamma-glutamate synthesis protein (capsule biosynthesis protein)